MLDILSMPVLIIYLTETIQKYRLAGELFVRKAIDRKRKMYYIIREHFLFGDVIWNGTKRLSAKYTVFLT